MTVRLRRGRYALLVAILVLAAGCSRPPTTVDGSLPSEELTAGSFYDSLGVNVHMSYSDTSYADTGAISRALLGLGLGRIRDGFVPDRPDFYSALRTLGRQGIKIDVIVGRPGDSPEVAVETIAREVGPWVDALEGPNEYDLNGGPRWKERLLPYQQRMYRAIRSDPRWDGTPVVGPSVVNIPLADVLDVGNFHPYPGGQEPTSSLLDGIRRARFVAGDSELWATETGYHDAVDSTTGQPGASPAVQAQYVPRLYAEFFAAGVARTYLYELADEKPDQAGSDPERRFGLLTNDLAPKPSYRALARLVARVRDDGGAQLSGRAQVALEPSVGNDVRSLLLRRRDGSLNVLLWREAPVRADGSSDSRIVSLRASEQSTFDVLRVSDAGDPGRRIDGQTGVQLPVDAGITVVTVTTKP